MTTPFRITCGSAGDIPSVREIRSLVTDERHLVLQFPLESKIDAAARGDLLRQLAADLPEFRVFESGGPSGERWIVVKKEGLTAPPIWRAAAAHALLVPSRALGGIPYRRAGEAYEPFHEWKSLQPARGWQKEQGRWQP